MKRDILERIATHEAGHFVLRWHLGLCATGIEIIPDGTGMPQAFSYGSGEIMPLDKLALLAAGGIAAEMIEMQMDAPTRRKKLIELFNAMIGGYAPPDCADPESDPSKVLDFTRDGTTFHIVFENALSILQTHWEKVCDVRKRLCANAKITKHLADDLFGRWNAETKESK